MFIKSLTIKNYKCFENETIDFNIPDGNKGSGLNMLIGENGNGKTTILEAVNYLTQSNLSTRGTLSVQDFYDPDKEISITGKIDTAFSADRVYGKKTFECSAYEFNANVRTRENAGRFLHPLTFDKKAVTDNNKIKDYEKRLEIGPPHGFGSRFPNFEVVYINKNRARHSSRGDMFPTKLDKILDDLDCQWIMSLGNLEEQNREEIADINKKIKELIFKHAQDKTVAQTIEDFKKYVDIDLKLDFVNILQPFSHSFFNYYKSDSLQQISPESWGSGVEIIFSMLLLKNFFEIEERKIKEEISELEASGTVDQEELRKKQNSIPNIVFCVDEPELHLHPRWQKKFLKLLLEMSKYKQIFIATQSPYFFKDAVIKNAKLILFNRDDGGGLRIEDTHNQSWGLFSWSPSWGEINYFAYDMPTVEFHNELYGYIESELQDVSNENINKHHHIGEDQDHDNENDQKNCNYCNKYWNDNKKEFEYVSLSKYIRNQIHHPDNKQNDDYSDEDFKQSIETMINLIKENE